ncbi:MAG TPA: tRNA preQ1(34) S-adenosylmethionine ribosyltransferase-isomerase QueA [Anaerolineae bacterium]|nr:tRNA preQ1(34) S-adenosylmethionine ribosyltransferase-isomerase QueA [Anaerolineae bacterium]
MPIAEYDYDLPPERIAQTPIEPRDHARMLVLHRDSGQIEHKHVYDIIDYLNPGDLLVLNDTRVIPARLLGRKETGGRAEVFLLRELEDGRWEALVKGKSLTPGKKVIIEREGAPTVTAIIEEELDGPRRIVRFDRDIDHLLDELGEIPLPPYIHRPLEDPERYQTIYGRHEGAVAAPTAGLHFTPELLIALREKGVQFAYVTLHVGLGTFQPVKEENALAHKMHSEWMELTPATARLINDTRLAGGRIVAVGTTSVRVLETAAKIALGLKPSDPAPPNLVCGWKTVAAWTGETDLYIYPGHHFRAVDAMLTNFHLPKSTLLLLVAAFAGKDLIFKAYEEAIREGYRFFSFGDAMLIL